ncbi:chromatin assembly factor 1 subunit A [Parasteatoda tepidariorum]|uniref:chromatin assembly factor 1 subunit A n=1 Tax=Parasteatoda tepidariorum TaxID=114398 RepID=UPI00077FB8E6|nr:chromatin assembly factor 1 subunit A [Parasteatoda tepidariorum]XP_042903998.1 chromatin assembly factor 1 subunit A [Parasteatoda tepidariorum]
MPLQDDQKGSTPFKNVDIKTLFLAASNRKRKASSPIPPPTEAKNVKVCDKDSDEDIQVLDASINSDVSASDCKENQDVNTLKSEQVASLNNANVIIDNELKSVGSDEHISGEDDSSKTSSDDLNSSLLNSSINALNTSGLSEANQSIVEKNGSAKVDEAASELKPGDANEQEKKINTKKRKRMTPEEAKVKAEEREKKQQEILLKKQERERELQQRKLQKEMEKKAKEEERKEKERLRLEKKEQEEKEKQLKQEEREAQKRMRQSMLEAKLEKKKQMEEIKLKQVEERKKAEEEKKKAELEKEQKEKEKKEKAKAAFVKFFVKENVSPPPVQRPVEQDSIFKPFQISEDMTLAPVIPSVSQERFNREVFDTAVISQSGTHLYLQHLKSGSYHDVQCRKRKRKSKQCETEVIVIETDEIELNLTPKLIQFHENVRPPYWGTWRKKSRAIRPRNPFGQDDIFDYDVDSDDEWEQEEPGESLSGTEQEDEGEDVDNYEEDEFTVPHGYLSAEEEKDDEETEVDNDPENRKKLLTEKLREFEMERKKKTTQLKPIILGCYIENDLSKPMNSQLLTALEPYSAVFLIDTPIPTSFTVKKTQNESKPSSNASSPTSAGNAAKSKKANVPDEAMPYLIRLAHGNHHSLAFLIAEFKKFWHQHSLSQEQSEKPETKVEGSSSTSVPDSPSSDSFISKRQLTATLRQIATKRSVDTIKKPVWCVHEDVREKYGLSDLPITNAWTYLTIDVKDDVDTSSTTKPVNSKFSIKEFLA